MPNTPAQPETTRPTLLAVPVYGTPAQKTQYVVTFPITCTCTHPERPAAQDHKPTCDRWRGWMNGDCLNYTPEQGT